MTTLYVVAVYDEDRYYGGPEEGGWWYTGGELTEVRGAFTDEDEAWGVAQETNRALNPADDDRRWGRTFPRYHATVVELPRKQLRPEYQNELCHGDADFVWNEDGTMKDEFSVVRWDVPTYFPEARPHYC